MIECSLLDSARKCTRPECHWYWRRCQALALMTLFRWYWWGRCSLRALAWPKLHRYRRRRPGPALALRPQTSLGLEKTSGYGRWCLQKALVAEQLLSSFRWLLPLHPLSYPTTTHPTHPTCIAESSTSLSHLRCRSCITLNIVATCTRQTHPPPCNRPAVGSLVVSATTDSAVTALVSRLQLFALHAIVNGRFLLTSAASSGNFRDSSSYP